MSPKKIAMKKFANTPAEATAIVPHFLSDRLFGLYGTGFAQPNKNGDPVITKSPGKRTGQRRGDFGHRQLLRQPQPDG